ncbi:MAG: hypothetical protein J6Y08_10500 [Clostridiales bacterium]|nr:hypothetical protein [Clostridiales bacterium]
MYNIFKKNLFQLRQDRTFWIAVTIFLLILVWMTSPVDPYHRVKYVGTNTELIRVMAKEDAKYERVETLSYYIRDRFASNRALVVGIAFCFVFFNREKSSKSFENTCAVTRDRFSVYFANVASLTMVCELCSFVELLSLTITILYSGKHRSLQGLGELFPFVCMQLMVVLFLVVLFYGAYLITQRILVPVVIFAVWDMSVLVTTFSVFPETVKQVIADTSILGIMDRVIATTSWSACARGMMIFVPATLLCMTITLVVIHARDLN